MAKLTRKQREQLYTKKGTLRNDVQIALGCYKGGVFRPVTTGFRNGHGTFRDVTRQVTDLLYLMKYKYATGNDAPRGGKSGAYIKVSDRAIKRLFALRENL